MKRAALSLAVLSLSCASLLRHETIHLDLDPLLFNPTSVYEAPRSVPREVRVVTFNIQWGKGVACAIDALSTHPDLADADVVLLQEIDLDGVRDMAHALDVAYVYDGISIHPRAERGWWGNAVLSRWPLGRPWVELLPGSEAVLGTRRRVVGAELAHPSGPIVAASIHAETVVLNLTSWFTGQRRQWETAAAAVDVASGPLPSVIGGDFNSSGKLFFPGPNTADEVFDAHGYRRVSSSNTPTTDVMDLVIDLTYARGFEAVESGVVSDTGCSDHFPTWVRLVRREES